MKAKEFLADKTLAAVETVESIIINLVVEEGVYGLAVDTSGIQAGTPLTRTTGFSVVDDVLTADGLTLDLATTKMLGFEKPTPEI